MQKLRNYFYSGKKGPLSYSSPFMKGNLDFDDSGEVYSWVDVFLRDDIHILGLGMDYTEIEMWWLIAFKARLMREKKALPVGSTEFYLFSDGKEEEAAKAKAELMESLEIVVHHRRVKGREYAPHYDWAIGQLQKCHQDANKRFVR